MKGPGKHFTVNRINVFVACSLLIVGIMLLITFFNLLEIFILANNYRHKITNGSANMHPSRIGSKTRILGSENQVGRWLHLWLLSIISQVLHQHHYSLFLCKRAHASCALQRKQHWSPTKAPSSEVKISDPWGYLHWRTNHWTSELRTSDFKTCGW